MTDQAKQKIEAWVEANLTAIHKTLNSGLARANCPKKKHDGVCCKMTFVGTLWGLCCPPQDPLGAALRRAILFGLELGKEAGPGEKEVPKNDAVFNGYTEVAFNQALTAKNVAIQEMIDGIKL